MSKPICLSGKKCSYLQRGYGVLNLNERLAKPIFNCAMSQLYKPVRSEKKLPLSCSVKKVRR